MQSNYTHPHYTLPGVMHYLQTEFTKNERDRITWELEKSEMKSYIVKLEGDNRELRNKLAKLSAQQGGQTQEDATSVEDDTTADAQGNTTSDANGDLDALMKSKKNVQENVKEIIYLLNGPNITSELDSVNDRHIPLHNMEDLNLNSKRGGTLTASAAAGSTNTNTGTTTTDNSNSNVVDVDDEPINSLFVMNNNKTDFDVDIDTDTTSIGPENEILPITDETDLQFKMDEATAYDGKSQLLRVYKNNILASLNGKLKYYIIDKESNCKDIGMSFDAIDQLEVKDILWLNDTTVLSLDRNGIKIWDMRDHCILKEVNIFEIVPNLTFESIIGIDYKNKWLLITTRAGVNIFEVDLTDSPSRITLETTYNVEIGGCMASILGITEKSFMVISNNSYYLKLIIYNFQGEILQTIDMTKDISREEALLVDDISLFLNKDSSKLLIQLKAHLIVYSFEQKRIVFQHTLDDHGEPTSLYFKYNSDLIGIGYSDGTVELRNLTEFSRVLFQYSHLPENTNDSARAHFISIDATKIGPKHIFLSLGENILKLETAEI